jgi:iron complex transport system ATP-binding protein
MTLLEARDLAVAIGGRTLVRCLDLELAAGERLAILGRNGAGKTTLLHTLAGLRAPLAGRMRLCGEATAALAAAPRRSCAACCRRAAPRRLPASVLETALIGRHPWHLERWAWESTADERIAREALAAVDLAGTRRPRGAHPVRRRAPAPCHRRAAGAGPQLVPARRAARPPRPQPPDRRARTALAARARESGVGMVMVLHDINLALRHADRALLLFGDGSARWRGRSPRCSTRRRCRASTAIRCARALLRAGLVL